MLKLCVLLVDEDSYLLAANKDFLERSGYRVLTAISPEQALLICDKEAVHVAVIDIRLRNNFDESDFSGLHLAAKISDHIVKIILTGNEYQNPEDLVRDVLTPDEQGRVLAADFRWKKEGHKKVLEAIEGAFKTKIKINPKLVIKGKPLTTLIEQIKVLRNLDDDEKQAAELVLQDLFCRLFYEKDEIRLRESTPGHSPCTVVFVHPKDHKGDELDLVVKIGPQNSIKQEKAHYDEFVKSRVQNPATLQLGPVWSGSLGALAYNFIGDQGKSVKTFSKYYGEDKVSIEKIEQTLTYLLERCCANWYANKRCPVGDEQKPLDQWFRNILNMVDKLHVTNLKDHLNHLLIQQTSGNFSFQLINDDSLQVQIAERPLLHLPNPLHFALEIHNSTSGDDLFKPPSLVAITHGDLHSGNVIIGEDGYAWLIDFFKTSWGPALRDFAELESDIKFTLLKCPHMVERYELEQILLAPGSLKDSFSDQLKDPTYQQVRAIKIIQHLRKLAFRLTGIESTREYLVALLFFALKRMMGFVSGDSVESSETIAQYHALLSAAMICERLQTEVRKASRSTDAEPRIFLSYATEDREKVNPIHQQLANTGLRPWIDYKDIVGGEDWDRSIKQAIHNAPIFIACLSQNSVNKRGFIQREVNQALDIAQEMLPQDIYIIPLMLENCEMPERLARYQAVRLYEADGWSRLFNAIEVAKNRRNEGQQGAI